VAQLSSCNLCYLLPSATNVMNSRRMNISRQSCRRLLSLAARNLGMYIAIVMLAGCATTGAGSSNPDNNDAATQQSTDASAGMTAATDFPTLDYAGSQGLALDKKKSITGIASYYGSRFAGRRTANGERFNPRELT